MKPGNWDRLTADQKEANASRLFNTMRGRLIMGQALAVANRVLLEADHPWREVSNAEDMEVIGTLFEPFYTMELEKKNCAAEMIKALRGEGVQNDQ